jgi:hypothetical protein
VRLRTLSLIATVSILALFMVGIGTTDAYFSNAGASAPNAFSGWAFSLWRQTSEADFEAGVLTNVDTASSPGDVRLPAPGTVTDHFDDQTKIASLANMTVTGGLASLSSFGAVTLRPNGDASIHLSKYPSGSESDFSDVSEATSDEDATYVYTASASWVEDQYDVADASGQGTITGVTVHVRARTTQSVATAALRIEARTGGTDYYGSDLVLTTSYTDYSYTWAVSPKTSAAWTWNDVNALRVGPKIVASIGQTRVTQVWVTVDRSGYGSPGTLTSTNLLSGTSTSAISSFDYSAATIPSGTTMQVEFSRDNSTWYSSAGVLNGFDTLSQGSHTLSLSALGWSGSSFYYKLSLTSNASATPTLDQVAVHYSQTSGSLASSVLDTGLGGAKWQVLSWDGTLPASTSLTLEVRASDTLFLKGASSPSWVAAASPSPIGSSLPAGRYKQWRATLTTTDVSKTSVLSEVRLYWSP